MAKTRQVLKLEDGGRKFSVVYHEDDKHNPYWVYRHTWGIRECGYGYSERKRIEVKYADLHSCLYYLSGEVWRAYSKRMTFCRAFGQLLNS